MSRYRNHDDARVDVSKIDDLTVDPVWEGMSLADFQRFGRYIRTVADTIGLSDWTIRLGLIPDNHDENDDEAPLATIRVASEARFATIRLSHTFADEPRDLQQITIVHEVLHIYFEPMLATMTDTVLPELVGSHTAGVATAYLSVEKERAIDALAVAISPIMPRLAAK